MYCSVLQRTAVVYSLVTPVFTPQVSPRLLDTAPSPVLLTLLVLTLNPAVADVLPAGMMRWSKPLDRGLTCDSNSLLARSPAQVVSHHRFPSCLCCRFYPSCHGSRLPLAPNSSKDSEQQWRLCQGCVESFQMFM